MARPKRPPRDGERSSGEKPFERGKRPFAGGGKAGADRPDRRPKPAGEGSRKPFAKRSEAASEGEGERIAKRLARAGIASRRDAEELIAAGRIKVNGKVLSSPAFNVSPDDTIELDGMEHSADRARPAFSCSTNRRASSRPTVTPRVARPCSTSCRRNCRG